jgi:hypothetical protein
VLNGNISRRFLGCGEHGDVISLVMKLQGLDFLAACEFLADPTASVKYVFKETPHVPVPKPVYTTEPGDMHARMTDADYDDLLTKTGINRDTAASHCIGRFDHGVYSIPNYHPIDCNKVVDMKIYRPKAPKGTLKTWHLKVGATNYLYGTKFIDNFDWCVIVGGEKDTILGHQLNLPFVTATSGEGSWNRAFNVFLSRMKKVYVWLDADNAGRDGMMLVKRHYPRVIVCDWLILYDPTAPSGYDFADFYADGGTRDIFLSMLASAERGIFSGKITPLI